MSAKRTATQASISSFLQSRPNPSPAAKRVRPNRTGPSLVKIHQDVKDEGDDIVEIISVKEGKGKSVDSEEKGLELDIQDVGQTASLARKSEGVKTGTKTAHPFFVNKKATDDLKRVEEGATGSSSSGGTSNIDPLVPFNYPPPNHPSYHLPPSPTYNHPIVISPPPQSLLSAFTFNTEPKIINAPADLDLLYFTRFIDPACSRLLTKYLLDTLPWYRVNYTTKGIDIKTPRYTTVFGKDSTAMPWAEYSKWRPRAIPEILLRLMQKEVTGETYNFTLVNYYSSGTDSISYHSDSERFLGPNPCIASISLGAPRDFLLRHVDYRTNSLPVQKFNLHDGDMVVMRGKTQHKWQHSIPKRAKAEGRINITFRKGIVKYATENYLTYNVGTGPLFRWEGGIMVQKE